jgi:2-(1,2-epoxy-1,2-dihydrophenyl)acetyl-CoA isomerase
VETVLVDRADGVVTVTMNRPAKKNAVNPTMWRELQECFVEVSKRSDDRVLILTGAGGAFCSGADLGDVDLSVHPSSLMRTVGEVAVTLHRVPKPTIAKVHGVAAGAGCNMALGCDLVVASEESRFCEIFSQRGLSLDFGGSWILPRLIGMRRAKELAFFGDMIAAKEAFDLGLVNRVVPAMELDDLVDEWAHRLAAGPPIALSTTKALLNQSFEQGFSEAVDEEGRGQVINFPTADSAEAMVAFLEKRQPRFQGR